VSGTTQLYYKDLNSNTCGASCPMGQFIDAKTPNFCQFCSSECVYCVDNAKKCLNSTSCATTYFYFAVNHSCLLTCPDGYYADATIRQCIICHVACEICTGPGTQTCTKCRIDTTQATPVSYYKLATDTVCSTTCPDGYYKKTLSLTCDPCDGACSLCNSAPDNCQQCNNNSGIIYLNFGNKCYTSCLDGYYGDPLDNKCKPCHEGCALCSTGSNKTCTACKNATSTGVIYYLEFGTTYCSSQCKDG
jgi:proprotein convertase subtilisin/kexin type 5